MQTAEAIRKLGFKRWYEKALIRGHAHLLTCLLGMTLATAGAEIVGQHRNRGYTRWGLAVGGGIALTFLGWYHYHRNLQLAEHLGARATCKSCGTPATFTLLAASAEQGENGRRHAGCGRGVAEGEMPSLRERMDHRTRASGREVP